MYLASKISASEETAARPAAPVGLDELDAVYGFIYSRVGNPADAEDLTQQVALKALPRLREGTPQPAVRAYLYATARSVMATFWSGRARLPEAELPEDVWMEPGGSELLPSEENAMWVARILAALSPSQRQVLELRFLRGYSLREVADEMGKTVGSIKVMQLRALRRAAAIGSSQETLVEPHGARPAGRLLQMQPRRA
jgi:RNA polymerase sigma-70 factor (ECF subfamily)